MNRERNRHVIESALAEKSQTGVTIENMQLFAESDSGQFALILYTCSGYPGSQQAICFLHTDEHVSFFETNHALLEKMDAVARKQRLTWPSVPKRAVVIGVVLAFVCASVFVTLSFIHKEVALVLSGVIAVGLGYLMGSQEVLIRCWGAIRSILGVSDGKQTKPINAAFNPSTSRQTPPE